MTKAVVNYLLCFLAGTVVALGCVIAFDQAPWHWPTFGTIDLSALNDWALALDPAVLARVAAAVLLVALLAACWRAAVALGRRMRRPPRPSNPQLAASSAERPVREQGEVNAVRDELERQLGRLIVHIADQLESSKDHVASLKDANDNLGSVTSVAELRDVVQSLISKNETNERQTRVLEARLKEAQDQTSTLRLRLTRAEKLASLDPLTSVANRRRFEQFISAAVDQSHANGTPLCLIMTDIDHFKKVNDTYGHAAGDRVLKEFADLLARNARKSDLVARYGGEEFAVVLPKTSMGDAFGLAERVRRILEQQGGPNKRAAKAFGRLTASFGVAEIRDGEPPSALIQRADQMLYEAKNKGRNRTMIWSYSEVACASA